MNRKWIYNIIFWEVGNRKIENIRVAFGIIEFLIINSFIVVEKKTFQKKLWLILKKEKSVLIEKHDLSKNIIQQ